MKKTTFISERRKRIRREKMRKRRRRLFGIVAALLICANIAAFRPRADDPCDYKTVVVQCGDTLWSLAEEFAPADRDLRAYVWEVKKINHLESSELFENQILQIPLS